MKCPLCQSDNPQTSRFCASCGTSLPAAANASRSRTQTLTSPLQDFATGALFAGRFQIIEELGHGGMGKVYKALDTKIQEKVAIKIIRPEIAGDEKTISRFRNELKLARQITHRNVCRMHDLGEERGTHFITMEYVAGENLKRIIRMTGPLTVATAVDYSRQICEGLAEAHRLGVTHRDLKPQNIIIDESGAPKIMDFGIAWSRSAGGLTGDGAMVGTPDYMSPEQAEGKPADPRSDIYALGLLMYEMVTGKLPFEGDSPVTIALKHKTEIPRPPLETNPQIPAPLNDLILKCLEKDADKRFQNAGDLLTALGEISEALPQKPVSRRTQQLLRPRAARRIKLWPEAGIAVLILAVAVTGYFLLRKKPLSETRQAIMQIPSLPSNSMAVLPIKDLSEEQNRAIFCEGMTDNIRTKLSELGELKVINKNSSERSGVKDTDIKEIGQELRVQKILSGTLQTRKDRMWINLNLSDSMSGFHEWSNSYDVSEETQFRIEDQIVQEIYEASGLRINQVTFGNFRGKEPIDYNSFKYVQEGKILERKFRDSRLDADFSKALEKYKVAAKLSPDYALAHWSLGRLHEARYGIRDQADDLLAMQKYFSNAFKADPSMAEAHIGLGWVHFYNEDFDRVYESLKAALSINHINPNVIEGVGALLRSIGLYEPAIDYFVQLTSLDPLYPSPYFQLAACHWFLGEYDKAVQVLQPVKAFEPENARLCYNLARSYLSLQNYLEAEKELDQGEKIQPLSESLRQNFLRCRVWLHAARGEKKEALDLIKQVGRTFYYEITNAYCLMGMKDEAIQNIHEGIDRGFHIVKDVMYVYPYLISNRLLDTLQGDPRFVEILNQEKKKHEYKIKAYQGL
jgi:serine/threonine-protein kinase